MANGKTYSVFVTSYGVANEKGFASGKWFDLEDYADKEDFIEAATDYMKEEWGDEDPELAFPDYELETFNNSGLVSESSISASIWDLMELSEEDVSLLEAYINAAGVLDGFKDVQNTLSEAEDAFAGLYSNDEEFAYEYIRDVESLNSIPDILENAIDWKIVAKELMHDYYESNGYYFRAY